MAVDPLKLRLQAVKEIIALFKLERIAYLCASILSVGILLFAGLKLIVSNASTAEIGLMFGATGVVTLSVGRLLTLVRMALKVFAGQEIK